MKRILIIEDDPILCENIAEFLQKEHFETHVASNGEKGLHIATTLFPDLILCDISMPVMDGYEVYRSLQKNISTSIIPFIFLTAKSDKEDIRKGMGMGVNDYIVKPFNYDDLLNSINKRIEKQNNIIKANEEKYRALIETSLTGVFMVLSNGFEYINDKFSKITGYTKRELRRILFTDLVFEDDVDYVKQTLDICLHSKNKTCQINFRIRKKDNEIRHIEMFAQYASIKNEHRLIGNVIDVTDQKNAIDIILKAKEDAEIANRAKSEFLANVTHEIRTPLNGIIGMAELLLDDELSTDKRENLDIILSSANDLLVVVNDIIDISIIESGKITLSIEKFNLRNTVQHALAIIAAKASEKKINLTTSIADACSDILYGDETKLKQILFNIAGNAVKFTSNGSVNIDISVKEDAPTMQYLLFQIKDSGCGVPVEKQEIIFNPFQQVDGSTTRKHGGTGLGLSISKKLIEIMGGTIWLSSEVGKGSIFSFIIGFNKN